MEIIGYIDIQKVNPVKELYINLKIYEEIKDEIKIYENDYKINIRLS